MHACLSPKVQANNTIYREPYAPKKNSNVSHFLLYILDLFETSGVLLYNLLSTCATCR